MWKRRIRQALLGLGGFLLALALAGWAYVHTLDLEAQPAADPATRVADLDFLRQRVHEKRGRILAVVTSTAKIPGTGKNAGFELTELARAYYVFVANGYEVDIASPRGGAAPMKRDEDLVEADYAFLNDPQAQRKIRHTLPLSSVETERYAAVYFVGGKGAMFDFPEDAQVQRILAGIAPHGVVGAICHGPAALLNARDAEGRPLLRGKRVTGFSNEEELFLMENARALFPFLLQDRLTEVAGRFVEGPRYLDNTVVDGRLVTGQNPWSTWSVAEAMVRALGHRPVPRAATREETGVHLLLLYHRAGLEAAIAAKSRWPTADTRILLMHALVAAMQGRWRDAWRIQRLARA